MESDLKKDHFTNENFDIKQFFNSRMKPNSESESDIFNFKLTMIQREFLNEIDLNMNNLIKFSKNIETDVYQTQIANRNFSNGINESDKFKLDNHKLEELNKIVMLKNKNEKIEKIFKFMN